MSGEKDIQIVRGNNNRTAKGDNSTFVQGDNNQMSQAEQVSTTEVIEMLAYLEEQIQNLTALSEAEREKSVKRLEAAKVEVIESEPDKESIAKSLKRVNETLNEAGETTQEVKELVKELFPTVVKVAGWLGCAVGKIWMV
jgi:carbamoylphosphate synthase large subunit